MISISINSSFIWQCYSFSVHSVLFILLKIVLFVYRNKGLSLWWKFSYLILLSLIDWRTGEWMWCEIICWKCNRRFYSEVSFRVAWVYSGYATTVTLLTHCWHICCYFKPSPHDQDFVLSKIDLRSIWFQKRKRSCFVRLYFRFMVTKVKVD